MQELRRMTANSLTQGALLSSVDGSKLSAAPTNATILVVEDDTRSARMFSATMSAAGHRVLLASSGEQAEQLISDELPDLILCDICLPGIDGIELTRKLRAQARTRDIP